MRRRRRGGKMKKINEEAKNRGPSTWEIRGSPNYKPKIYSPPPPPLSPPTLLNGKKKFIGIYLVPYF
jgi:hypothetical protein